MNSSLPGHVDGKFVSGPFTPDQEPLAPGKDLETFRSQHTPNVTSKDMKENIETGKAVLEALKGCEGDLNKVPDSLKTPQAVVGLMWALTAKAAEKGQLYTSGAMRLQTKPNFEPRLLEGFIKECGKKEGLAYSRISTHMKENILKGESQSGIDLRGMGLPAGKGTVLFADQHDGTIYLKMEEHGCPPFWQKGFRSFANFKEFVKHSTDFITTRFDSAQGKGISGLAKRKEHVPENIKKEFNEVVDLFFPKEKKSFFEKLRSTLTGKVDRRTDMRETFKEIGKQGITASLAHLETLERSYEYLTEEQQIQAQRKLQQLRITLEDAKKEALKDVEGYTGEVKGQEVILTLN